MIYKEVEAQGLYTVLLIRLALGGTSIQHPHSDLHFTLFMHSSIRMHGKQHKYLSKVEQLLSL